MIRTFLACLLLGAVLASCASRGVAPPRPAPECAVPQSGGIMDGTGDNTRDGGIGGTGKAPETCDESPSVN